MKAILISLFLIVLTSSAMAEQKKSFGDYDVHYMALTSSELDKDVAKLYGITRSRNLGYMMISVMKNGVSTMPVAWDATLEAEMSNLIGQKRTLEFTRIQETDALYFYSTFDFYDKNHYRFHVKVNPQGEKRTFDVKFDQKFYRGE